MYGSVHSSASIVRLSVAGVVLWIVLSLGLATVVGVAAWTLGHEAGAAYSPAQVTRLQSQTYTRGYSAGYHDGRANRPAAP